MSSESFIQNKAAAAIAALYGANIAPQEFQVSVTRKEFEGDYTLVVFPLLRISHASPEATGEAIGAYLKENVPEIAGYNCVKGFLNLLLSPVYWDETLKELALDKSFGQLPSTGRRVMVEFSSPNTNKPLHLGHIRNNLLGDSVSKILAAGGNTVIKSTIVNDRGVHICKSMLAWKKLFEGKTPESTGIKGDHLVGDCYVAFDKMYKAEIAELVAGGMDEEQAKKEAPSIKEAHEMLLKWEQGDPEVRELWKMMNGWVYKGFDETYAALGITFDQVDYESNTYILGKELVRKGLETGVFERETDGSVWCDLTADGLDRKLVLRGDGTSVYITQDLGTAERRFANFNLDSHVYVVGNEQDYHFQVLKLILGKLGFDWAKQIYHLSYGMVELPAGKMKSREGTVVDADDLIQAMYEEAKKTSEESGKLTDLSDEEKDKLYHVIGLGALKYFIIKVDPKKTMLFNPAESIDFNGNTGPFIQYTHARICSILRKAAEQGIVFGADDITNDIEPSAKEIRLVKLLSLYPAKIQEAVDGLSPAILANYSFEIAKEFNQYYHDTQILKEPEAKLLKYRLQLISVLAATLRSAMALLGIELPERM
ncbi:MAG: arginine--tRNA ligase [Bacteroidales bacterium]|nr:arginine--tRNA ligase [Bacteroidales bacterium]MBR0240841.1 arginine--tRNA ligase [Bacteroidales bacterium]